MASACANPGAAVWSEEQPPAVSVDPGESLDEPSIPGDRPIWAVLQVVPLDIWAEPLAEGFELSIRSGENSLETPTLGPALVALYEPVDFQISLTAESHVEFEAGFAFEDPSNAASGALALTGTDPGHGVSLIRTETRQGAKRVPMYRVFVGVRHSYFASSGRPARSNNAVELLMDGEEGWGRAFEDLTAARESIHLSTWNWNSDFELVREANHSAQSEAERDPYRVLSVMENSPAKKRIVVGQFISQDGIVSRVSDDRELMAHGEPTDDNFEVMGEANPSRGVFDFQVATFEFADRVTTRLNLERSWFDEETPIESIVPPREIDLNAIPFRVEVPHASIHQKFFIVDDQVAHVGGMNLKLTDWDTSAHEVFEPRRMDFDATETDRRRVLSREREPDQGPRKDYAVRINGPAVRDVADVFSMRWHRLLEADARHASSNTMFDPAALPAPVPGGVTAQVTATMPAPYHEHAIAETWFNAVEQASEYIFIEDQYFRIPMLVDLIIERMNEVPNLRLIVVTKPVNQWTDPGCVWTFRTHQDLRARFPIRYLSLQLRSFDTAPTSLGPDETQAYFVDLDVHSKILLVDDEFLSVGSANMNNRGILYEAELNVAVVDHAWVTAARHRILANILPAGASASDDVPTWFETLRNAGRSNDIVRGRWEAEGDDLNLNGNPLPDEFRPQGMIYGLEFPHPTACFLESIGPDVT